MFSVTKNFDFKTSIQLFTELENTKVTCTITSPPNAKGESYVKMELVNVAASFAVKTLELISSESNVYFIGCESGFEYCLAYNKVCEPQNEPTQESYTQEQEDMWLGETFAAYYNTIQD